MQSIWGGWSQKPVKDPNDSSGRARTRWTDQWRNFDHTSTTMVVPVTCHLVAEGYSGARVAPGVFAASSWHERDARSSWQARGERRSKQLPQQNNYLLQASTTTITNNNNDDESSSNHRLRNRRRQNPLRMRTRKRAEEEPRRAKSSTLACGTASIGDGLQLLQTSGAGGAIAPQLARRDVVQGLRGRRQQEFSESGQLLLAGEACARRTRCGAKQIRVLNSEVQLLRLADAKFAGGSKKMTIATSLSRQESSAEFSQWWRR